MSFVKRFAQGTGDTEPAATRRQANTIACGARGKVDSPEMADVFVDLIGWLRLAGVALEDNPSACDTRRIRPA